MPTLCECSADLSVIIPVYNLEEYLQPMLDSLLGQDLGDYKAEIIFVLNNCTDASEYVIRDSGLDCTILNCTTQGCGPARNMGMDHATGEYIWFMDGDDWLLSNTAIKDVLDRAYADNLDILYIPFRSELYHWQYFSMVPQYLMRREFIGGNRFPNYQPAEDDAFMIQMLHLVGLDCWNYFRLPRMEDALYYYNYGRPGSNMMRYYAGEKI